MTKCLSARGSDDAGCGVDVLGGGGELIAAAVDTGGKGVEG